MSLVQMDFTYQEYDERAYWLESIALEPPSIVLALEDS